MSKMLLLYVRYNQFEMLVHACLCAKSLQLCLYALWTAGSFIHGILQARILEWVATSASRGSSQPRDQTQVSCLLCWRAGSLPLAPLEMLVKKCISFSPESPQLREIGLTEAPDKKDTDTFFLDILQRVGSPSQGHLIFQITFEEVVFRNAFQSRQRRKGNRHKESCTLKTSDYSPLARTSDGQDNQKSLPCMWVQKNQQMFPYNTNLINMQKSYSYKGSLIYLTSKSSSPFHVPALEEQD